ncbi:MAG: glycosyl hydrolase family 18 protein [Candidatus Bathyarchaeia archaeon]
MSIKGPILKKGLDSNKLIPLIADFHGERILRYLRDPAQRKLLAKNIYNLVVQEGFDGINIDIEFSTQDISYREYFTAFIADLATRLHSQGKLLSVDVPAMTYDARDEWNIPFDYRNLGVHVDHLILMAYGFSSDWTQPGPIAPTGWIEKVIDYTTSQVDRNKVVLGIPFYGFDWFQDSSGKWHAEPITFEIAYGLLHMYNSTILWNSTFKGIESNEPYFKYKKDGVEHIVFFQNGESVRCKLEIANLRYIRGIAIWRLGGEDESNWLHIDRWRRTLKASISIFGLRDLSSVALKVDGIVISIECNGLILELEEGVKHTISVDKYVLVSSGIRYFCQNDSISIPEDSPPYIFKYKKQYRLIVSSLYGSISSWHDEGSTATYSVNPIFPFKFKRWSGNSNATTLSSTIVMDCPKNVTAILEIDRAFVIIIVGLLAAYFIISYSRKKA